VANSRRHFVSVADVQLGMALSGQAQERQAGGKVRKKLRLQRGEVEYVV